MARKTPNRVPEAASPMIDREDRYRAQDALRTLTRAEEIKKDRGLMREVKKEAKAQIKATSHVIGGTQRKKQEM